MLSELDRFLALTPNSRSLCSHQAFLLHAVPLEAAENEDLLSRYAPRSKARKGGPRGLLQVHRNAEILPAPPTTDG
jgi:hypothetical protein